MKKIVLILAVLLGVSNVFAGRYDYHLVDFWGGAGYSGLVNNYPTVNGGMGYTGSFDGKFIGGGGGILGVGYEYRYKKFMLNTGLEFRLFSSKDKIFLDSAYHYSGAGMDYDTQTKHYRFNNLSENQVAGQVMLPVLAGATFEYWYFLAGVKVGYTVFDSYKQKGVLKTTLTDSWAYEPEWEDLPSHGIQTADFRQKGKNKFGFDATLSAEIGLNINPFLSKDWNKQNQKQKYPWHMRVALFADYGLPNMNIGNDVAFAQADAQDITTTSLHQSEWAGSRLNSLLVGVKFTALLQLTKPKGPKPLNPRMVVLVEDSKTGTPLGGTKIAVYNEKTKRTAQRTTNAKGWMVSRYPAGNYRLTPTRPGYLPMPTIDVQHEADLRDTITFSMVPEPVLSFRVTDAKTGRPISANLEFTDIDAGKVTHTAATDSANTEASRLKLPYGHNYKVTVSAPDYLADNFTITDLGGDLNFGLQPVEKGRTYVIQNLFFATNETTILPESEESLNEMYEFMKDNKDVRIRITGHTDAVGSDADNQKLSEGRAESVKKAIVERGINADRIETEGKGESQPVATNDTEEGRAKNRRVEFVIL